MTSRSETGVRLNEWGQANRETEDNAAAFAQIALSRGASPARQSVESAVCVLHQTAGVSSVRAFRLRAKAVEQRKLINSPFGVILKMVPHPRYGWHTLFLLPPKTVTP